MEGCSTGGGISIKDLTFQWVGTVRKNLWKQDSHINHIYESAFRLCLERTMQSFLLNMESWVQPSHFPEHVVYSGGIGWFSCRAKFSLATLSRRHPRYIPDAVRTHLCTVYSPDSPLFWSENELSLSPALSTSESFFLTLFFFFLSPTFFSHIYETSTISCAWANARRVSQPARLAAIIFIHRYMQPVSLPSEQGQTLPWWSKSSKQCPKLQLSFGVGSY